MLSPNFKNLPKVDLAPMSREDAAKLVRRLLAGYPTINPHDPEGYIAALVQVMAEYPKWAGDRSITAVDREKSDFPPSDRKLRTWLDEAVRPWRYAADWDARSQQQVKERKAIEPPKTSEAQPEEARGQIYTSANFHEAVAAHGRPLGVFETEHMGTKKTIPYRGGN